MLYGRDGNGAGDGGGGAGGGMDGVQYLSHLFQA